MIPWGLPHARGQGQHRPASSLHSSLQRRGHYAILQTWKLTLLRAARGLSCGDSEAELSPTPSTLCTSHPSCLATERQAMRGLRDRSPRVSPSLGKASPEVERDPGLGPRGAVPPGKAPKPLRRGFRSWQNLGAGSLRPPSQLPEANPSPHLIPSGAGALAASQSNLL